LINIPEPPADAAPLARNLDAFTGRYASSLYGSLAVVRNGSKLKVSFGPRAYPDHLVHWSGDTFLLTFDNPDVEPGLLTFDFAGSATAKGLDGSKIPDTLTVDYGHFARVASWNEDVALCAPGRGVGAVSPVRTHVPLSS
jgi:hypothetical protein